MKKHTGDIAIGSIQQGERTASSVISVNSSDSLILLLPIVGLSTNKLVSEKELVIEVTN